ncbi:fumarylacetoacetate hydrolase family protein [Methanosarcina sp.]|uniref:fumarylacetoacetate hydrolase family protein n=1 Tax=Methanosarcina sp. TaxID=2213 RepID=UPI002988FA6D|nr:fumarylacetoacetate hydrolase family protein [Methanosarcina sp.]MDW5549598.1 fumarylacetoacetate hydrolase family protein [Methanosarcina sp.]MDW5553630.1 fumarylacetoacetate hydrolase family protein [Methanosarcina sp.]MDW5558564.1 fumarylacetoacetate hydrolase family protein [Methanosarcina sp.]
MIGRFRSGDEIFYGDIENGRVYPKGGVPAGIFNLSELRVLPPASPSKIVCVGLNYRDHAEEMHMEIPEEPVLFLKPSSAVIGHEDKIIYPASSSRVEYEAELAFVIGKRCKNISASKALDVIAGYTCFNDVTARDLQYKDVQWTRSKSFDTFAAFGPYLASPEEVDISDAKIACRVNGETMQASSTSNLIFDIPYLIEFITEIMTLEVGDVIATGTPPGVGELQRGDIVEVEIQGIGTLRNEVV